MNGARFVRRFAAGFAVILATAAGSVLSPSRAFAATPAFVQAGARQVGSGTTNAQAFGKANTAGNLIAVYVLWNNTGAVTLTDSRSNAYAPATPRVTWGSNWSAQIFYAKNIAAGTNTVTATFATGITSFGIVYVNEYSGVSKTNPVDVTASAIGSSSAMSSGSVTTTNANDLLFAAGGSSSNVNKVGTGFTSRSTAFGNRTEDRVVTTTGSYAGTATQNGNAWVMQLVAFRNDTGTTDSTPPSVPTGLSATAVSMTQINLTWTASTDNVAVTGYTVFRDGTQVGTSTTPAYSDTGLVAGTTHTYVVSAFDAAGNNSGQSTSASATTFPDTTAPTVSVTAPANGSTVSGTVTVTANASDNVAVTGVQFLLDGNSLGSEDTTSPYSVSWDTTTSANGAHTITARARDAATNTTTSTPVTVTVSNTVTPPPSGLVAAYAFNEGAGTTAADSSGHGFTGTLVNGPTWTTGKYGSAVNFAGANDYVDLGNPTALQLTGSMTVSGWINSSTLPGDDAAIVSKKTSAGIGFQLDTTIDTGSRTVGFKLTNSSGTDMMRYGATALQVNTWYYVAGVYDAASQTMNVYLNGVLDNGALVGTVTSSQQDSPSNVNIGQRPGGGFGFIGSIDEVRIYNRALAAGDIQTDMTTPLGGSSSDWTSYFHGNDRTGFGTADDAFNTTSASNLHLAWKASDTAPNHGVFSQPIVTNGKVYWGSFDGYERATDTSGHLVWQTFLGTTSPPFCSDPGEAGVASTATVTSDVPIGTATSVLYVGGGDSKLYALDANTGAVLWSTLVGANPDHFIWSSPAVLGNSVYIGVSSFGDCPLVQGQLLQFDRTTGALQHTFNTVPSTCQGGGVWGSPTIDATAGTIYFTTGNADGCSGPNDYGEDIVEVRASDLSLVGSWTVPPAEQTNDSDFGATPTLFNAVIGGQSRALVGAINKNGIYYAFTRDALASGPVWEDRIATGGPDPTVGVGDVASSSYDGHTLYIGGDGTTVGTASCSGTLNAVDPATGAFLWRNCFEDGFVLGGVTSGSGGVVAVGEGSNIAIFSAATGASLFTFKGTGPFFGPPSISKATLYEGDMAGNLYALTTQNQPPVAVSSASTLTGPTPLAVNFSSAGSVDPEGQSLTYSWDFGDGTTSQAANPAHTYTQAGRYTVQLSVSDGVNTTAATPLVIAAGSPPTATILSPTDGAFFRAGDVISFSGNATDPHDGTLPASAFSWRVDFLNGANVNPGVPVTGVTNGSFTIPTTGQNFSGNTRYRITLTVTNSVGLTDTKSVTVWPTKVNLSFNTVPAGLTLYVDGVAFTTPFVDDALVGYRPTIEARNQTVGSASYSFQSWSDGGAQQHVIVVPSSDESLSATYSVTASATPTFVQVNSATPQTPQSTVAVPYAAAQSAGNLDVVAIGFFDATSTITSVTDSAGNVYKAATPLTRGSGMSQAIYYAANIKAATPGANAVTVRFSGAVAYPDVRIAEYSGIDPLNPVDTTASAAGNTINPSSGNFTTTTANDLIFGAGYTTGVYSGGASGFTARIITPSDADIVVDRNVTSVGTYAAAAVTDGATTWVFQGVAFRAAGQ